MPHGASYIILLLLLISILFLIIILISMNVFHDLNPLFLNSLEFILVQLFIIFSEFIWALLDHYTKFMTVNHYRDFFF